MEFNLEVVKKDTWKFIIQEDTKLTKSNNEPKEKVKNLCKKILEYGNIDSYDLIESNDMIAFKFAPMKTTYIFDKNYYESKCYNSPVLLKELRKIKL